MPTDTERLDWLAHQEGGGLISNDFGRWALPDTSTQNLPPTDDLDSPFDVAVSFFVKKGDWYLSIREAIDAAIARDSK